MARKKRHLSFEREAIIQHAMHHHPFCPVDLVARYADEISEREWETPLTLGHAFGLTATNHVRHQLTDYDCLLRVPGLTREEARIIVSCEVLSILNGWARKPK